MPKSLDELQAIPQRVRREIVEMTGAAASRHPGGSLSAVVAQAVAQIRPCPMAFVGIQNTYAESGQPYELLEEYGLTAPHIADAVREVIARKR